MTGATLLVELLTEELPPKALPRLGQAFADGIAAGLRTRGLAAADGAFRWFATPRRLAVSLAGVLAEAAAKEVTEKIMPVSVALGADGQPTPALVKKLEAKGIPLAAVESFERRMDGKAEALFYTSTVAGAKLAEVLAGIVQDALKALPIPKVMRWGDGDATFVRPAHKLTMLHGADGVPGRVLDIESGRITTLQARLDVFGQHLAQLHAPLVKAVDAPQAAAHEHAVLLQRNQCAQRSGGEGFEQHQRAGAVAGKVPVPVVAGLAHHQCLRLRQRVGQQLLLVARQRV